MTKERASVRIATDDGSITVRDHSLNPTVMLILPSGDLAELTVPQAREVAAALEKVCGAIDADAALAPVAAPRPMRDDLDTAEKKELLEIWQRIEESSAPMDATTEAVTTELVRLMRERDGAIDRAEEALARANGWVDDPT